MSRIGKKPVSIPKGVSAEVKGQTVAVKGPKGRLEVTLAEDVVVAMADGNVVVSMRDTPRAKAMWGMSRSLVQNMVNGVTQGYSERLEIIGVGYRAALQGKNLQLNLGFSHDVIYPIPEGIQIQCEKPTSITISGIDKQKVGQVAAEIRKYRRPEPYKGKGIKYLDEKVQRKEGKKK